LTWAVQMIVKTIVSTCDAEQKSKSKLIDELDELTLETPEEAKFRKEQQKLKPKEPAAGSYERLMSFMSQ